MSIYLGNLKTEKMMIRLGVQLSEKDMQTLNAMRTDNADVEKGKWHCFDLPFQITCGDIETAKKVIEILQPFAGEFKTTIQIAYK